MRRVLAHHFADDTRALARSPIRLQPHLLHGEKYSAVDGFQAVADVGEGAADDHRHGVVEIGPLHFLFNVDGLNVQRTGAIATGRRSKRKFGILIVWHVRSWLLALGVLATAHRIHSDAANGAGIL